jgi:hypothetical protein
MSRQQLDAIPAEYPIDLVQSVVGLLGLDTDQVIRVEIDHHHVRITFYACECDHSDNEPHRPFEDASGDYPASYVVAIPIVRSTKAG